MAPDEVEDDASFPVEVEEVVRVGFEGVAESDRVDCRDVAEDPPPVTWGRRRRGRVIYTSKMK